MARTSRADPTGLGEACSAQGARAAGHRYSARQGAAGLVLRHSGLASGQWWLVAAPPSDELAETAYLHAFDALPLGGAVAIWLDGRVIRFGDRPR